MSHVSVNWSCDSKSVTRSCIYKFLVLSVNLYIDRFMKVKIVCKDQEIKQSKPKSSPHNQNGKKLKLQIVKSQREHMVNRVSRYFQEGGNSACS